MKPPLSDKFSTRQLGMPILLWLCFVCAPAYAEFTNGEPLTIIIDGVTSDAGVASANELSFCSADTIHCHATIAPSTPSGIAAMWIVSDLNSGEAIPNNGAGELGGDAAAYDFNIENLPSLLTAVIPRDRLQFTITVLLLDGELLLAASSIAITQSDLGQLRQEYVDHRIHVPHVSEFAAVHKANPGDPGWNTGDYDWAIISQWAIDTDAAMNRTALALQIIPENYIPLQINSVYRNPCHESAVSLEDGQLSLSSLHQYGRAIDYQVFDWDASGGVTQTDWRRLFQVAAFVPLIPKTPLKSCFAGGIEKWQCSGVGHLHVDNREFP
jgi:hypothetical protein